MRLPVSNYSQKNAGRIRGEGMPSAKFYEMQDELKLLRATLGNMRQDSITHSAARFINSKGLSEEWAQFMIAEIEERCKRKDKTNG